MSEIFLCNKPMDSAALRSACGLTLDNLQNSSCGKPESVSAYTPYLMNHEQYSAKNNVLSLLSHPKIAKRVTDLSLTFGAENTLALSEMVSALQEYNPSVMGAGTSVFGSRVGGFAAAVRDYQRALLEYRDVMKLSAAAKKLAKQKALASFQRLQIQFQFELNSVGTQLKARKGNPLSNFNRASNIASDSRSIVKLDISSQVQASNLAKFSKYATHLGNGLVLIDVGSRIGNIQNSYQSGENWERELFIESSSFAASAASGIAASYVGAAVLGCVIAATPLGWVLIIGAAAAVSIGANNIVKNSSGGTYDWIMQKLY